MGAVKQNDREAQTRERACWLWDKEGRPEGQHVRHWREAEAARLVERSALAGEAQLAQSIARHIAGEERQPQHPQKIGERRGRKHTLAKQAM